MTAKKSKKQSEKPKPKDKQKPSNNGKLKQKTPKQIKSPVSTKESSKPNIFNINFSTQMNSNLLYVSVHDVPTRCLVDTGAMISCISKSLLQRIQQTFKDGQGPVLRPVPFAHAYGVGGEVLDVQGSVILDIRIEDKILSHKFHVFDRIHHSMILGMDFLTEKKCKLDLSTFTLSASEPNPVVCSLTQNCPKFHCWSGKVCIKS